MMDVIEDMETQLLQPLIDKAQPERREAIISLLNGRQTRQGPPDLVVGHGQQHEPEFPRLCAPMGLAGRSNP